MADEQQSPINIENAIYAELGDAGLSIEWTGELHGHIEQGDHGLKVVFPSDFRQYVKLGGKVFHLRQFHFHHPSEHWVDGQQHSMELHIVHQNASDGSLAVIGVFLEPGKGAAADSVGHLLTALSAADANGDAKPEVPTDPHEYLPKTWKEHYRYEGSLTTDPYSENVSWVVVRDPLELPKKEFAKLLSLFKAEARFPLPRNRRFILKTFDPPKAAKKK
ncbi:carbonic anhydrase family protein [Blastopirellula marina]|nr:carbonic anhydrase family protein [Blastopirellula marina]